MQAPLTESEVERLFAEGVREKIAQGWTLYDIDSAFEELTFTLTRSGKVEQHVAHIDHDAGNAYRIDAGVALPGTARNGGAIARQALTGKGGFEFDEDCGRVYPRFFVLEGSAKGAAAGRLVARTLKASEDVEDASIEDTKAVFAIDIDGGKHAELRVTLDDDEKVIAAELRRYEYGPDLSTYTRQEAMRQKLGATVTKIVDGDNGPKLIGSSSFEINRDKIERHPDDGRCGC